MTDAVTVTDESIWKPEDVQPGVKVGTYQASEVWMIAYETSGSDGRLALVSLSDGMIAHRHKTREELAQMFNEDRRPHVAALATQPQDQRIAELEAELLQYEDGFHNQERTEVLQATSINELKSERDQALAREEQLREALESLDAASGQFLQAVNLVSMQLDDGGVTEGAHMAMAKASNELVKARVHRRKALSLTPPQDLSKRDGEVLALRDALQVLWDEVYNLMDDSDGVAGLHQNGDLARWEDLLGTGWLSGHEAARVVLLATTQAAQDAEERIREDEREVCAKIVEDYRLDVPLSEYIHTTPVDLLEGAASTIRSLSSKDSANG